MEGVDSLTDLVTNVSLQENAVTNKRSGEGASNVSSNFHTPLPPRTKRSQIRRSHSISSFVSASSSPEPSNVTLPKSQRTIDAYMVRTNNRNNDNETDNVVGKSGATSTPIKQPVTRKPAPNIVAEILAEKNMAAGSHSSSSSESTSRGSKRKRNASKPTDNYVEVRSTNTKDMSPTSVSGVIEDIIQPTTSDILLAESGRPTETSVTFVSDNRGKTVNSLSVSFQVPQAASSDTGKQAPPSNTDDGGPPEIPAVDLTWMEQLQLDYFLTTRSSVVSEARAKLRGMMLGQCTDKDLIHPWALHLAPMPVYLTPHADVIVPFLKQQALELQRFCSDTLLEFAEFQVRKIEVDKDCLRKVLDNDVEKYKRVAGALFDARRRVKMEVEEQLVKQHKELSTQQVPDKELASKVRGVIPRKFSYADAVRQTSGETNSDPVITNTRSRSRSRSRNRNSNRGRSQSRPRQNQNQGFRPPRQDQNQEFRPQRQNQDFRQPRAPTRGRFEPSNNNDRRTDNTGTQHNGARPKTSSRPSNDRPRQSGSRYQVPSRPEWTRSDINPEPLDWHDVTLPSVTDKPTNPPDFSKLMGIDNRFFTPDVVRKIAEAYDSLNKY